MSAFYTYFKQNMDALHLPAPSSLFGTADKAFETIKDIAHAIGTFGLTATIAELTLTAPALSAALADLSIVYPACKATFYLGACIGSAAIATGRTLSGGAQMSDFFALGNSILHDQSLVSAAQSEYSLAGGRS